MNQFAQIIQQNSKVDRSVSDLLHDLRRVPSGQRNEVIEAIKAELNKAKIS